MANEDTVAPATWQVLGTLIKLRFTDPAEVPCTADFLTAACNQVSELENHAVIDKPEVHQALASLIRLGLVQVLETAGRFQYGELTASHLGLTPSQQALFAVLLINDPLTVDELMKATYRLYPFRDSQHLTDILEELKNRAHTPLARHWPANTRGEPRFTHSRYQENTFSLNTHKPDIHPADELDRKVAELGDIIDHLVKPKGGR